MDTLILLLIGGFILISMIRHGRRLTQSNIYVMRIVGNLSVILGVIMLIIFLMTVISGAFLQR